MRFVTYHGGFSYALRPEFKMNRTVVVSSAHGEPTSLRRRVLKKVDHELAKGNTKGALSLVKHLQGKPGGLRGFGAAKQVPQRHHTLDELDLNGMDTSSLKSQMDLILDTVKQSFHFVALSSESSYEEMETLMLNTTDQFSDEEYHSMCNQHEAGHFLIAYLLGVLPKEYIVPSLEAMKNDDLVGGKVDVVGFEFLNRFHEDGSYKHDVILQVSLSNLPKKKGGKVSFRVNREKVSTTKLNKVSCVSLAGMAAECLGFGYSEGSQCDVQKLDELFKWLGYTESEIDSQVRWAVLNTTLILHRHYEARSKLTGAMSLGRSIGSCIDTIENALDGKEI